MLVFALGSAKEWWQRRRERNGLLRVLFSEVAANHRLVGFLLTLFHVGKGEIVMSLDGPHVSTKTWEATRIGLAQHLRGKELAALTEYHRNISGLGGFTHRSTTDYAMDSLRLMLNLLDEQGIEAQEVIRKYVPDAESKRIPDDDLARLEKGRSLRELIEEDE